MTAEAFIKAMLAAGWNPPRHGNWIDDARALHARLFAARPLPAADTIELPAPTNREALDSALWLDLPADADMERRA